ncbi:MAG: cytosine deaminase [Geoglossum umbratile]|nr:MAG: cytosine deaminase [Geoglossum umbratile]
MDDEAGLAIALEEAEIGAATGGVPIGAAIITRDGRVIGKGHNQRVQKGSATLHGEIAALENAGRQPAHVYKDATMYTTLSPCDMCTGACLLFGIRRVVLGENNTFAGAEELLRQRGVEVVNLRSSECEALLQAFIREHPEIWNEDIGEEN